MQFNNSRLFLNSSIPSTPTAKISKAATRKYIMAFLNLLRNQYNLKLNSRYLLQPQWLSDAQPQKQVLREVLMPDRYIILRMHERIESIAKLGKYAVFEDQLTGQSKIIQLQLLIQNGNSVNLSLAFQTAPYLKELLNDSQVFYMNPNTQICQLLGTFPFNEEIFIEIDRRKRDRLYFKFRRMMFERKGKESLPTSGQQMMPGPRKSKERTIAEVRHYLESWKLIYNSPQQSGVQYTLQQAAEKVGLPKKTLDDYDRQIKMAKAMNFNFQAYRNAGMGVMRNFVRNQQEMGKGEDMKKEEILEPEFFLNIGRSSC